VLGIIAGFFFVPYFAPYSMPLLFAMVAVFVVSLATMGYLISTVARNQMQALQMTFFFFMPSMLLSGFMFPFHGLPGWAQAIGEVLPLTHMLRIVRGIMLKGAGFAEVAPHLWPLLLFLLAVTMVALTRFRRTLDA